MVGVGVGGMFMVPLWYLEPYDEDNDKAIDHARRAGLTQIVKVLE